MSAFDNSAVNTIIFESITQNEDLQTLLDKVSSSFSLDIYILSIGGTQLFSSSALGCKDKNEYFPVQTVTQILAGESECIHAHGQEFSRMLYPFRPPSSLSGSLIINYANDCQESFVESVGRSIAKVYNYFFHGDNCGYSLNIRNHIIARFLLLKDNSSDLNTFIDTYLHDYSSSGMAFRQKFAIAAFQPVPTENNLSINEPTPLSRYIPNSFYFNDGSRVLAFIFGLDSDRISTNTVLFSSLNAYCDLMNFSCAISRVFDDLSDKSSYIRQASSLLEYKLQISSERVFLAEDNFADTIISGAIEQLGSQIFILSDITSLVQFDIDNNTKYLETLENYLKYAGNYTQAANNLYIDRGTLKYRMEKIKKLLSCDPDDPSNSKRLLLAINVYKYFSRNAED